MLSEMKKEIARTVLKTTENGATGHSTTGHALLDMNFKVSSYRNLPDNEIVTDFIDAFNEDPALALRWLFFARDVRGGMGERRLFRVIMNFLANENPDFTKHLLPIIAEYGRWDDLIDLLDTPVKPFVTGLLFKQFQEDLKNANKDKPISLLGKWMPSINCHNEKRRGYAKFLAKDFGMTERTYRKSLSVLRKKIDVVEKKMSSNDWDKINYEHVPSKANVLYNKAFFKHDPERREEYICNVKSGTKKINSSTNFPHDIVHSYGYSPYKSCKVDDTLEALWKALPEYGELNESTMVVADGSGSMSYTIGNTNVSALEVANSLAIYFAERCKGEYKNNYITFSMNPKLVNLKEGTLLSKIKIAFKHSECANTNIEAVFDLVLKTAVKNNMKQEDIPATILILSDMEFDECARVESDSEGYWYDGNPVTETLFQTISKKYKSKGYKMPKLVFWNIMSRTNTIPVIENDMGVALVSGFSPAVIKMVTSGKADPYLALVETLQDKRYDAVEEIYRKLVG